MFMTLSPLRFCCSWPYVVSNKRVLNKRVHKRLVVDDVLTPPICQDLHVLVSGPYMFMDIFYFLDAKLCPISIPKENGNTEVKNIKRVQK